MPGVNRTIDTVRGKRVEEEWSDQATRLIIGKWNKRNEMKWIEMNITKRWIEKNEIDLFNQHFGEPKKKMRIV